MLKIFETLINLLAVLAIATFALTLFLPTIIKKIKLANISDNFKFIFDCLRINLHYNSLFF